MLAAQHRLPRSNPEEQGISSKAIHSFIEHIEQRQLELHSFMFLRHGHVVAEGWWAPYAPNKPHALFSLSKSFTSTAVGLAVEEGLFSVEERVISFFPEEATPKVKEHFGKLQVRHLLTMSTGHDANNAPNIRSSKDGNWVKAYFESTLSHTPGTQFLYSSDATYMLSAIMQKRTGQTLGDYLQPRLFEPLGIAGVAWETCPLGINTGGWGLSLTTEDVAKFGQLYLRQGQWNGRPIIPAAWIQQATSRHISNGQSADSDWTQGYGYQFWRCRHDAYRGDGAYGQFVIVMPEQDAVIAITSGVSDMQAVLNQVWDHLLPACREGAMQADVKERQALSVKLSTLAIPPHAPSRRPELSAAVSGALYVFEDNEMLLDSIQFDFSEENTAVVAWHQNGVKNQLNCGLGTWLEGPMTEQGTRHYVAASGSWQDGATFVFTFRLLATPFCQQLVCQFHENTLTLDLSGGIHSDLQPSLSLKATKSQQNTPV
ncbi:serine hydrolase domain-containing protein [Paenibacillus apiarius]|uniref:Beta-lactamase family protein n=1 Tax=Paenibacillus apiarius TaxID=46240 RepID=A0ABT4DWJ4_9BACL|nr:serine hydrolase [Paenibacillus apiarius]MCY9516879.1 beta-lactamase family protein [Paenibacillus apiarius]MCY9521725.1 beta-lactamase family protein [Paenibacillus apiarius]MCY9551594.1 beta-lactamase family protein [Paenibacillus apiarius]MCY9558749.1 beta-lactamase family protein [Paenibacillus apiarius]MCY9683937.1 beta-lactamase family protein [Paenibacillus apiarius]